MMPHSILAALLFQISLTLAVDTSLLAGVSSSTAESRTEDSKAEGQSRIHRFQRQVLTDMYFSEGAAAGDLNNDSHPDVVYGPHWYAGPDFQKRSEIYPAVPQDRNGYADSFFSWVYDFNGDGHNDVLAVGFPGKPAFVFENPGPAGLSGLWEKHQVADQVSNEAPQFTDLTGDGVPELICTRNGHFGYYRSANANPESKSAAEGKDPKTAGAIAPWNFVEISDSVAPGPFVHGLGVGDVNGDGRPDLIAANGWWEHPAERPDSARWVHHPFAFAPAPADLHAYDVDGDGDQDIITALHAHEYGLAWFENTGGKSPEFQQHTIVGKTRDENPWGVLFTEPHSVKLEDINGDGLKDIVTGKTYWSHHTGSPMWDAGAVVYWFELRRHSTGAEHKSAHVEDHSADYDHNSSVEFVPHLADGDSGIGRQLVVADLNGDQFPDLVTGGMKGASVLLHQVSDVDELTWQQSQPKKTTEMAEGLSPVDAAARMTVPDGFHLQLAAGEPMVHQPVAMCFDHRGRLWIAEAHTYPLRAEDGKGKDRIVIFEDTNLDGAYDKSTVFIEGLNLVSGLEVGFGGVFIGAAPYLMFIPDRDGDDRPDRSSVTPNGTAQPENVTEQIRKQVQFPNDVPEGAVVLRDGFGWQDTHETLNSFIWGPDGWLYGCHGVFTHSRVGRPGDADENRLPLNAAVWRYHPLRDEFEAFMNGTSNPWGVDFNDRGQAFITACVIPHLWHVVQGARYHRQGGQHFNPHTYDDIKTIADHAHYVGDIREHAWWGHEPKGGGATSDAGGGHAHCGAMIYLGDNFPDEYRNRIYFNNVHGNRVNCDILETKDSGYVGHHGKDLILAKDRWYRGINLRYGPDGSVILIDWYDKNACHRVNPEIWDRTSGRIYRLVHGDRKPVRVDLSQMTDAQLTEQLFHRNEWYVRMARRLLMERNAGPRVRAELIRRLTSETEEPQKLRALWTLSALQLFDENLARGLLKDSSEFVRAWTIQLMLDQSDTTANVSGVSTGASDSRRPDGSPFYASLNSVMLKTLTEMASTDSSPIVRRYLASALQRIAPDQRWELAQALVQRAEDERDHNMPLLLWYGVEPLVAEDASRAIGLASKSKISRVRQYLIRRACAENSTIAPAVELLSAAANDPERQKEILDAMLEAFRGRVGIPMPDEWKGAYATLSPGASQEIQDRLSQIAILFGDVRVLGPMRKLLSDSAQDPLRRRQALDVLLQGRDLDAASILQSDAVLDHPELQGPAIRAMATLADDRVPVVLLQRYSSLKTDSKRDAIATLCARPNWSKSLLQEIAGGKLPSGDLHAFHVRQIQSFQDPQLNELLLKHWGDIRESSADRQKQIAEWKQHLKPRVIAAGNAGNGRRVFARTCQNCHRLFGTGGEIGPDITGANRGSLDYLLENMIDPSSVVGRDYQVVILQLKDGRVINGLVRQDTDSALTIQTINDRVIVPKADIEERSLSSSSMMPEKQLDALTKDEVRDLIAYLQSPAQVTLSGPPAPIDPKTGRVPGALEAEGLKILEKTSGTVSTQAMNGFPKDRWSDGSHLWWTSARPGDHLTIEITAESDGIQDLEAVFTRAPDYGIIQVKLDDQILEPSLDLFNAHDVVTTGVLRWTGLSLNAGSHRLSMEIIGTNSAAVPSFMVGLDYVRFLKAETPGQ